MNKKFVAILIVFCMLVSSQAAFASITARVKYNYTYPSEKYKIVDGKLTDTWNSKKITSVPGGASREYYAYGACQCSSTLSQNKSFYVHIGIRKSGATSNESTASLYMLVPKNGKSSIEKETGTRKFFFTINDTYMYHVNSNAPSGIKGIYQGGANDRLG